MNVGTLAVNQVVVVTIHTTIKESATGTIVNEAEVHGNEFETNTQNNHDDETRQSIRGLTCKSPRPTMSIRASLVGHSSTP